MANPGDQFPPGDDFLISKIQDLQRKIDANASARSLAASQIGAGGLHINGGGSLNVDGGGTIILNGISLASLIGAALSPAVGSSSAVASWPMSYANFTTFNFTVPTGYTRVLITASGGCAENTGAAGPADDYRMRVVINGSAGAESRAISTDYGYISAFSAASLSGLTAGASIPIALQGHLTTGPASATAGTAALTGMAIFLP